MDDNTDNVMNKGNGSCSADSKRSSFVLDDSSSNDRSRSISLRREEEKPEENAQLPPMSNTLDHSACVMREDSNLEDTNGGRSNEVHSDRVEVNTEHLSTTGTIAHEAAEDMQNYDPSCASVTCPMTNAVHAHAQRASSSEPTTETERVSSVPAARKERRCCICNTHAALYTCPRCACFTCSIACIRVHKVNHKCSGTRDVAMPIGLHEYNDAQLQRDFHFLEDCHRVIDNAARHFPRTVERRFHFRALPPALADLRAAARRRGVVCQFISAGMQRRRVNTSYYDRSRDTIMWHCEFRLHIPSGLGLMRQGGATGGAAALDARTAETNEQDGSKSVAALQLESGMCVLSASVRTCASKNTGEGNEDDDDTRLARDCGTHAMPVHTDGALHTDEPHRQKGARSHRQVDGPDGKDSFFVVTRRRVSERCLLGDVLRQCGESEALPLHHMRRIGASSRSTPWRRDRSRHTNIHLNTSMEDDEATHAQRKHGAACDDSSARASGEANDMAGANVRDAASGERYWEEERTVSMADPDSKRASTVHSTDEDACLHRVQAAEDGSEDPCEGATSSKDNATRDKDSSDARRPGTHDRRAHPEDDPVHLFFAHAQATHDEVVALARAERVANEHAKYFTLDLHATIQDNLRTLLFISEYPVFDLVYRSALPHYDCVTKEDKEALRQSLRRPQHKAEERQPQNEQQHVDVGEEENCSKHAEKAVHATTHQEEIASSEERGRKRRGARPPALCRAYRAGRCTRGKSCPYAHHNPGRPVRVDTDPTTPSLDAAMGTRQPSGGGADRSADDIAFDPTML